MNKKKQFAKIMFFAVCLGASSSAANAFMVNAIACNDQSGGQNQISANVSSNCVFEVSPGSFASIGTASSSSNLATGELKSAITTFSGFGLIGSSSTSMGDTITLTGLAPTDSTSITLSMYIDGKMLGQGLGNQAGNFTLSAVSSTGIPIPQVTVQISNPDQGQASLMSSGAYNGGNFQPTFRTPMHVHEK